ncbi:MAG: hypothetical protein AAF226_08580, partial [Verrucomicrobiota bacterium]
MKKFIILIYLINLLHLPLVVGQNAEKKSGIQFTCLLWEGAVESQLYYGDGDEKFPITPFLDSRSEVHSLKKSRE